MEKDLKKYEIGFLAYSEEARNNIVELLKVNSAEIINDGGFSKIKLAYPVKKHTSAFFGYIQFSSLPSAVVNLKDSLKLNSQILRFMIIILNPKALLAKSSGRFFEKSEAKEFKKELEGIEVKKIRPQSVLSNEDLEKKLEEILK
ncbi:30S ribosomal protein S6 [Candidatus Wolfebacteria bacterium]|nr:30S ribosomal protein S6 [Candidatus Wolfebacteria bacterium]